MSASPTPHARPLPDIHDTSIHAAPRLHQRWDALNALSGALPLTPEGDALAGALLDAMDTLVERAIKARSATLRDLHDKAEILTRLMKRELDVPALNLAHRLRHDARALSATVGARKLENNSRVRRTA